MSLQTQRVARSMFCDVKGQRSSKRALEVAAAGAHSVLMVGPPGAGKTMLASRFPGLLPGMSDFPARFQLIAAINPCPCGFLGHPFGKCDCTRGAVLRYQGRISGPLLDRIDIQIEVAALRPDTLLDDADGEPSNAIAARVALAHQRQLARQGKQNQALITGEVERHCRPDKAGKAVLRQAMLHLNWSARVYHLVLKVARTIADPADAPVILDGHVSEAIQLRRGLREP